MNLRDKKELLIKGELTQNGFLINAYGEKFKITYPSSIWQKTPKEIKEVLLDNLTFGDTHFLPLILGYDKARYTTKFPLFESTLYRNQMMGMLKCEKFDHVPHLSYLRQFYNLQFTFANKTSALPFASKHRQFKNKQPVAIIPFTFGKESMLTFALCRELGIKPVLVYSQEPSQPFEEKYKKKKLIELSKKYKVDTYFVPNGPGLIRYGQAFKENKGTEIGWSSQTTLLCLQVMPFVFAYQAQYILLGNEYLNNEYCDRDGWRMSLSPDQNSFFTKEQDAMVRLLTDGNCGVRSSLEPIDEINIFSILHKRYPELGKYQFSCAAEKPLYKNSQWCHNCYKCARMFVFASCIGVDPYSIGFKEDILNKPGLFENYFGPETKSGSEDELDFSFYILYKKGAKSIYVERFMKEKLPHLKPWKEYYRHFINIRPHINLPEKFHDRMIAVFTEELEKFKKYIT